MFSWLEGLGKTIPIWRNKFLNITFASFGGSKSNNVSETISYSAESDSILLSGLGT